MAPATGRLESALRVGGPESVVMGDRSKEVVNGRPRGSWYSSPVCTYSIWEDFHILITHSRLLGSDQ